MTSTLPELLEVCLWDLHAGGKDAANRLPGIITQATDTGLRGVLEECAKSARSRSDRIAAVGKPLDGPENIWMQGILDDAERDTRSIAQGRLLDLAMIGAVRKALAAEQVSTETALAVADALGEQTAFDALASNGWDLKRLDAQLQSSLFSLA